MRNSRKLFLFSLYIILPLSTFLSYIIGIFIGNKFLLPVLNVLFPYPFMIYLVSEEKTKEALHSMLLWAFFLIIFGTIVFSIFPQRAEEMVINGKSYRDEMFNWIKTGVGRESNPEEFIPQHLIHIGIFVIFSFVSASLLSIIMGSVMVNYMNFYVSQLILNSKNKIIPVILGWHFWSLIRVLSFVILGVILSEPMVYFLRKGKWKLGKKKDIIFIAFSGLILDIILKALFSPLIREILKRSLF